MKYLKRYESITEHNYTNELIDDLNDFLVGYKIEDDILTISIVSKRDGSTYVDLFEKDFTKKGILDWAKKFYKENLEGEEDNEYYYNDNMKLINQLTQFFYNIDFVEYIENDELGLI